MRSGDALPSTDEAAGPAILVDEDSKRREQLRQSLGLVDHDCLAGVAQRQRRLGEAGEVAMVLEVVERRRRRGNGLAGKGGLAHLTGAGQQRHRSVGYGLVQVLGVNRPVYQRHPASLSLKINHVMHDLAGSSRPRRSGARRGLPRPPPSHQPGGLHGEISRTRLFSEPLTSSRNSHLARRTSTDEDTRGGARYDPSGSAQATPKDGGDRREVELTELARRSPLNRWRLTNPPDTRQTPADATITVLPPNHW